MWSNVLKCRFKNMNPLIIKIGISVAASAAAYFFFLWRSRRVQESSHLYTNPGSYDGSNVSSCCICLIEFTLLKKNEVVSLPCRHKICRKCCEKLFTYETSSRRKCPECRCLISETFVSRII